MESELSATFDDNDDDNDVDLWIKKITFYEKWK